jgi:hypothetical protein
MKLATKTKTYILVLFFLTLLVSIYAFIELARTIDFALVPIILALSLLLFLADLSETKVSYSFMAPVNRFVSAGISIPFAALLLGVHWLAIPIVLIGTIPAELALRKDKLERGVFEYFWRVAFNVSQIVLATFLASQIFILIGGKPLLLGNYDIAQSAEFLRQSLLTLFTFAFLSLSNVGLVSGILFFTTRNDFFHHFRHFYKHLLQPYVTFGLMGYLLAILYSISFSLFIVGALVFGVFLFALRLSVTGQMNIFESTGRNFFGVLCQQLERYHPELHQHSERVSMIAAEIGSKLELPEDLINKIKYACLAHHIGAIEGRSDEISLAAQHDSQFMRVEISICERLLKAALIDEETAEIATAAFEKVDGSGIPNSLKGDEIHIGARILSIADAIDLIEHKATGQGQSSLNHMTWNLEQLEADRFDQQILAVLMNST